MIILGLFNVNGGGQYSLLSVIFLFIYTNVKYNLDFFGFLPYFCKVTNKEKSSL